MRIGPFARLAIGIVAAIFRGSPEPWMQTSGAIVIGLIIGDWASEELR